MAKYIIKRLIMCIIVILCASFIVFTIMYFIPGDPAEILLPADATQEQIAAKRDQLGLNDPYLVQLGKYLFNAYLRFDFGEAYLTGQSVFGGLVSRMPITLGIGLSAILLSVIVAIPLGIAAGLTNGKWQSVALSVLAIVCVSIPDFWLALLLIIFFSVKLNLLPSYGMGGIQYFVMPVLALAIGPIGGVLRQMRSGMLDVMNSDYVITARAKGVPERRVTLHHMLPNALIPVITIVGSHCCRIIGGTVIIEQIFSIPGVGTYMLNAINNRDYPIVRGSVIVLSAVTSLIMLIVDLVYAAVDPRIKAQYSGKGKR